MKNPQSIEEACEILEMYKSLREEPFGKSGSGTVRMKAVKSARGEVKFVTEERFDELKVKLRAPWKRKWMKCHPF